MKKRTAVIMLGIMLTASLIAGCGNNKATEAASESVQTEKEGTGEAIPEDSGISDTEETSDSQKEDSKEQNKESSSTEETSEKDTDSQDSEEAVQEDREKIAVLLPEETSWETDGDELKTRLEEDGYEPVLSYADNDVSRQVSQIQDMTAQEVSAMVIAPVDTYGLKDVLSTVKEAEIPVFSYDELIMDTDAVKYYVTYGGRQIGQMIGEEIIKKEDLDKVKEDKESRTVEFIMGSQDNVQALFLYNGVMETLQPYLDDGTLVCKSGRISFDDTGILRWSTGQAKARAEELLTEVYPEGEAPDIICTGFDNAAVAVTEALEENGIATGTESWPLISGYGCKAEAVKKIAEGRISFSIFADRKELADQCEEMVNVYLHGEDDPEVNDYEQYDNGIKIIGSYLCEPQMIDNDNYEILVDSGYYTKKEVEPEATPTSTPTPAPEPSQTPEATVTPTVTETPDETPSVTPIVEPTETPSPTPEATVTITPKPTTGLKKAG